jgi:hypothetical protein
MVRAPSAAEGGSAGLSGFAAVLALFILALLLVSPAGEFPLNDDWIYSSAVVQRLETGSDLLGEGNTNAYLYPQRFYGTAVASLFGFSFVLLRGTGILAALICLFLAYRILARLGFSTFACFAGTSLLLLNPLFLNLTYSFMTDLPYLAFFLAALLCYLRAAESGSQGALLGGALFTTLALAQRQMGILLVPAALLFFIVHRRRLRLSSASWIILLLPVAAFGALTLAHFSRTADLTGLGALLRPGNWARMYNMRPLSDLAGVSSIDTIQVYGITTLSVPTYLGLFLLPILVAGLSRGLRTLRGLPGAFLPLSAASLAALLGLRSLLGGAQVGPLQVEAWPFLTTILNRCGIGAGAGEVIVGECLSIFPPGVWTVITLAGLLGAALLVALFVLWAIGMLRAFSVKSLTLAPHAEGAQDGAPRGLNLVLLAGAFQVIPLYLVWPQDRYLVPLILPAAALVLDAFRRIRLSRSAMALGLLLFGLYGLAGLHDYLSWNRLRWEMGRELVAEGVRVEHIEGGLEWDGWHLYFSRARSVLVPLPNPYLLWFTRTLPELDPKYLISFSAVPGYRVLRSRAYHSYLHRTERSLYLSRRGKP